LKEAIRKEEEETASVSKLREWFFAQRYEEEEGKEYQR
jgi:hypothetical protein